MGSETLPTVEVVALPDNRGGDNEAAITQPGFQGVHAMGSRLASIGEMQIEEGEGSLYEFEDGYGSRMEITNVHINLISAQWCGGCTHKFWKPFCGCCDSDNHDFEFSCCAFIVLLIFFIFLMGYWVLTILISLLLLLFFSVLRCREYHACIKATTKSIKTNKANKVEMKGFFPPCSMCILFNLVAYSGVKVTFFDENDEVLGRGFFAKSPDLSKIQSIITRGEATYAGHVSRVNAARRAGVDVEQSEEFHKKNATIQDASRGAEYDKHWSKSFEVQLPVGVVAGQTLSVTAPDGGAAVSVTVPVGCVAGQTLRVQRP